MPPEGRRSHVSDEGVDAFQRLPLQPRGSHQGTKRAKTNRRDQRNAVDSSIYDALAVRRVPGEVISMCRFPENMLLRSIELPFEGKLLLKLRSRSLTTPLRMLWRGFQKMPLSPNH